MNYQSFVVTLVLRGGNIVKKKFLADSTWHAIDKMYSLWSKQEPNRSMYRAVKEFRKV